VKKYGKARPAADNNTAHSLCCWATQARHTQSEDVILIVCPW